MASMANRRSPYVSPVHKLTSVGGLEAMRRLADAEHARSGNVITSCEGKRARFTGFALGVIKGPSPPPPHSTNQVAVEGGNDEKAEIEFEGQLLMDETSKHSARISPVSDD